MFLPLFSNPSSLVSLFLKKNILLLFRYSCLHLPPTSAIPTSLPWVHPPWFCPCVLYNCSWKPLVSLVKCTPFVSYYPPSCNYTYLSLLSGEMFHCRPANVAVFLLIHFVEILALDWNHFQPLLNHSLLQTSKYLF